MSKKSVLCLCLAIISSISLIAFFVVSIVNSVEFNKNCTQYIKRAANASTIETAKEELAKAISYAEENDLTKGIVSIFLKQPKNDVGFWYNNMKNAYEELESIPDDATPLEKTNVLMKLRESLTDQGDSGMKVIMPEGMDLYPYNALHFWWFVVSLIATVITWMLFAVAHHDDIYYY